jgi:hypothetical protein
MDALVSVPLVGLPCEVLSVTAMATVRCRCEGGPVLSIPMGHVVECPQCRRALALTGLSFNLKEGPGVTYTVDQVVRPGGVR